MIQSIQTIKSIAALVTLGFLASACAQNELFGNSNALSGSGCPNVAILEAPGELTRFVDGKVGKLPDVLFKARMEVATSTCDIEGDTIHVTADAKLKIIRGPAETKREVKFNVFIGVIDGNRSVVSRHSLPVQLKFQGPDRIFEFEDSFTVPIDLPKGVDPASYSIYGGFEMTPEELEFNRRKQR